jgi:hypothetical protein
MDFKNLMDRAKDAATAAANKASEAAASLTTTAPQPQSPALEAAPPEEPPAEGEQAVVVVTTTTEQTVVTTAPAKSFGALASEKITQISQAGSDKIQELVGSFQKALPALKSAGYEITEFEVELGVTPKLIPHFKHAPKSAEDIEAAKEMLKDNKLGQILLGALLKAGDVHKQIKVAGFGFSHIEIEMGLIPSVRLQYKKD